MERGPRPAALPIEQRLDDFMRSVKQCFPDVPMEGLNNFPPPKPVVTFLGEQGAGKTTLINQFLRIPLLFVPNVSSTNCGTICNVHLTYGPAFTARVTYVSANDWVATREELAGEHSAKEDRFFSEVYQAFGIDDWRELAPGTDNEPENLMSLLGQEDVVEADRAEQLAQGLQELMARDHGLRRFVTSEITITAPLEPLRHVDIIDTPGQEDFSVFRRDAWLRVESRTSLFVFCTSGSLKLEREYSSLLFGLALSQRPLANYLIFAVRGTERGDANDVSSKVAEALRRHVARNRRLLSRNSDELHDGQAPPLEAYTLPVIFYQDDETNLVHQHLERLQNERVALIKETIRASVDLLLSENELQEQELVEEIKEFYHQHNQHLRERMELLRWIPSHQGLAHYFRLACSYLGRPTLGARPAAYDLKCALHSRTVHRMVAHLIASETGPAFDEARISPQSSRILPFVRGTALPLPRISFAEAARILQGSGTILDPVYQRATRSGKGMTDACERAFENAPEMRTLSSSVMASFNGLLVSYDERHIEGQLTASLALYRERKPSMDFTQLIEKGRFLLGSLADIGDLAL